MDYAYVYMRIIEVDGMCTVLILTHILTGKQHQTAGMLVEKLKYVFDRLSILN